MCYVEAKGNTSDPDSNMIYRSNSEVSITKSNKALRAPQYIYTTEKSVVVGTFSIVRNLITTNRTTEPNPVDYYVPG